MQINKEDIERPTTQSIETMMMLTGKNIKVDERDKIEATSVVRGCAESNKYYYASYNFFVNVQLAISATVCTHFYL